MYFLFLSFFLLLLSIIIISSLLTPPHPQPLVQLSLSNGCEVTPTSVLQDLSIISVLQIESNLLVLGMTLPSRKQLHLSVSTALCIYSTPLQSY